jgi:RNA polymerase sigma-70 factor (ECF subfamily)
MNAHSPRLSLVGPPSAAAPVEFDELYRRHAAYVAGVAARLLGRDDHEVDDVVQDVFCIAAQRLAQIYDMDRARPWLVTVAIRVVRRKLARRRFRSFFTVSGPLPDVPASGVTPEEQALLKQIYRQLDAMSVDVRIAWCLRHLEEQSLAEVAAACDCSLATAKRRILAAETLLSEVIRDE